MVPEAAGLAVLAALSPTALLIAAVYLGSDRPRLTASLYLAGAVFVSTIGGVTVLAVLRHLGVSRPAEVTPRYGLRLGLGVLLLAAGLVVAARHRRSDQPARQRPGMVSRMAARPTPSSAFAVGLVVFAPGATFVAAIQVIATASTSLRLTVLALAVVVVINVMLVWLPVLNHLVFPEATGRWLSAFNRRLRANGPAILAGTMMLAGVVVAVDGIHGLAAS